MRKHGVALLGVVAVLVLLGWGSQQYATVEAGPVVSPASQSDVDIAEVTAPEVGTEKKEVKPSLAYFTLKSRGQLMMKNGQPEKALKFLRKAVKLHPDDKSLQRDIQAIEKYLAEQD